MKNNILVGVLFLIIGVGIGYVLVSRFLPPVPPIERIDIPVATNTNTVQSTPPVQTENDLYSGWGTYQEKNGLFTFRVPPGYKVSSLGSQLLITEKSTDRNPSPTPSFSIRYSNASVQFSTWEGMEWKYYHSVVDSFKFEK